MHIRLSHRRSTAWLAMWLLLWGALMPLVSQAVVHMAGRSAWQEVCTTTGMVRVKWVAADAGRPDKSTPATDMGPSCPVCNLHGGVLGLPPSPQLLMPAPVLAERPPAFYQAARTASVWLTAQSRAPPSWV